MFDGVKLTGVFARCHPANNSCLFFFFNSAYAQTSLVEYGCEFIYRQVIKIYSSEDIFINKQTKDKFLRNKTKLNQAWHAYIFLSETIKLIEHKYTLLT